MTIGISTHAGIRGSPGNIAGNQQIIPITPQGDYLTKAACTVIAPARSTIKKGGAAISLL